MHLSLVSWVKLLPISRGNAKPKAAPRPVTKGEPIVLRPDQEEHFERILDILDRWPVYLDTTELGGGKTVITCAVSQYYKFDDEPNLPLFIVCPSKVVDVWERTTKRYGLKVIEIISYDSLARSSTNWVVRGKGVSNKGKPINTYTASDEFKDYARKGLMLVFDEVQFIKNENTARIGSALALSRAAIGSVGLGIPANENYCKSALLSATPYDKIDNPEQLLRMLGVLTEDTLLKYNIYNDTYDYKGLREICAWARIQSQYIPKKSLRYLDVCNEISKDRVDKKRAVAIVNELMNVVRDAISSAADVPEPKFPSKNYNYFAYLAPEQQRLLDIAEKKMSSVGYDPVNDIMDMAEFNRGLYMSEAAKLPTMYRLAKRVLESNPHAKVILYVNRKGSYSYLQRALAKYNPLMIIGGRTNKAIATDIAKFNEFNDKHRLLIVNPTVGGAGVEFDDRSPGGKYPRTVIAIPNFRFLDLVQAVGRVTRGDYTTSTSTIWFLYSANNPNELKILNSAVQKSDVVKTILSNSKVKFPSDFESLTETPIPSKAELLDFPPVEAKESSAESESD